MVGGLIMRVPRRLLSFLKWLFIAVAISTGVPVVLSFVRPVEWRGRRPNEFYGIVLGLCYRGEGDVVTSQLLPVCFCPLAAGLLTAVCWWAGRRRPVKGYCSSCGYDLTGNVSGTCPECGTPVDG